MQDELREQIALLARKLIDDLVSKQVKVQDKYDYYNADNDSPDLGINTPIRMSNLRPGIGWASRAVNVLADRVVFDGFANDNIGINDYMDTINGISVLDKAKYDAYIAGCAFVAIGDDTKSASTRKVLVPFTAQEATGEVDYTTGLLKWGLAVTSWKKDKGFVVNKFLPMDYILFTPQFTATYKSGELASFVSNPTARTLLHAITRRSSADRPLGKSRITNTARRIINEVARQKRREEIAEEFYSFPQRYVTGLAEGAKFDEAFDSAIGKLWGMTKDEDGEAPTVGQLQQMSIDGFETAKKDKARDFCAETGLTLRNLGYETNNPSSAESLSAMSDDLLLEAQNSQNEMGRQFKEIAITLRLALNGSNAIPEQLNDLIPAWKPIFQVDIGAAGDAVFKLFQAMPELVGTLEGYKMLGIGVRQSEILIKKRAALASNTFMVGDGQ